MGFTCGIVGLPNVGKSTLFNALTRANIAAANYPFCTIEPNLGIVPVPDKRLEAIADIAKPKKIIPTTMEFVDIAGLVAGASKGEGLGNQFLGHIRSVDAIAQVVRCFEHPDIVHVAGRIDPIADIHTIQTELALADLEVVERAITRFQKQVRTGDTVAQKQVSLLEQIKTDLNHAKPLLNFVLSLDKEQQDFVKSLNLLMSKPVLYVANVPEEGFKNNPHLARLEKFSAEQGAQVVPICAVMEAEIASLDSITERTEFLSSLGLTASGLDRLIAAGYNLLGLQTYFTAGEKEVRAWTVPVGATAPQAAGKIHTDFEQGFIRAEVISYEDYIRYRGETSAKESGKLRLEGKQYIVKDGDIMHFLFNV